MLATSRSAAVALALAIFFGGGMAARAEPIVIQNTTQVEAYNGANPTGWFGGSDWGQSIGAPTYLTPQLTITETGNTINFAFKTGLDSPDTTYTNSNGVTVYYADIFIGQSSKSPPASYQYAIALGANGPDGGLAAGLYQVSSFKTSQQIWSSRTSFIYGGQYAPAGDLSAAEASPTVLTGGTRLAGWTVEDSYSGGVLDVAVTAPNVAALDQLFDNFDLFWGTGDCSNAPLFAQVPEPASLLLLATEMLAFFPWLRRSAHRRRRLDANPC